MISVQPIEELKEYDLIQSYKRKGDIYRRALTFWIYEGRLGTVEISKSDNGSWCVTIMNGARYVYAGWSKEKAIAEAKKWLI